MRYSKFLTGPDLELAKRVARERIRSVVEKVHPIYVAVRHEWVFGDDRRVPTKDELEKRLRDMIDRCSWQPRSRHVFISCGGLGVSIEKTGFDVEVGIGYSWCDFVTVSPLLPGAPGAEPGSWGGL